MYRFVIFLIFSVGISSFATAESWGECFLAYQKFLRENFAPGRLQDTDTDEEKEKKRNEHRELAAKYAEFSDKFSAFAQQDGLFPPTAPPGVKRERSQKIAGTWILYKNVPLNAHDVWQEACSMKFRSLLHASMADPEKLAAVNEYADELETHKPLGTLFQAVKRTWYGASLRQMNEAETVEAATFDSVVADYVTFLNKYPTEENLNVADPVLALAEKIRSPSADILLQQAFAKIQRESKKPFLRELAEVLEGVVRYQGLLGKEMPIWGVDVNGKTLDPKTLDGKVVLLDFWATWCGPCIAEFPHLKKLYEKYRDQGFEIVGYCADSDVETMNAYLQRNPLPWIVLAKETSRKLDGPLLSSHYGAKKLPVVLLRDRDGKAVLLDARGEKLNETLEKIFAR